MTTTAIIITIVLCVVAFFVCAIPFGLIFAKRFGNVDVRTVGSGNIGTTNVTRAAGKKVGALTLLCDVLKGFVMTFGGKLILANFVEGGADELLLRGNCGVLLCWIYFACICGHCFSPYLGFKGGKGIAVGLGGALGFTPGVAVTMLLVFLAVALPTAYVSLGSACAAVSLPVLGLLLGGAHFDSAIVLCLTAAVVLFRHRENIIRLTRGEESKFSFKKSGETRS